ncbi:hypothetical protein ACOMHN_025952 [Nucella lapillus]
MAEALQSMIADDRGLWVFAYGSLLWKPCVQYHRKVVGHIKGFKRRFFLGNTNLRGSLAQPGRVAILVPDEQEVTWGVAYEIRDRQHVQHAVEHLYFRETAKGGYHTMLNTFHPRSHFPDDTHADSDVTDTSEPFTVITFTATPSSQLYLGPADVSSMAQQVMSARGEAGSNAEYVLRTAEFVRDHIPEDQDQHLFGLERRVRELLAAGLKHRKNSVHCETASAPTLHTVTVPV